MKNFSLQNIGILRFGDGDDENPQSIDREIAEDYQRQFEETFEELEKFAESKRGDNDKK